MWLSLLWKLLSNPKNLAIVLLSIFLVVSAGSAFYYKQKVATLQVEVKVLKVDNENLKAQIKQANDHNSALRQQIVTLQTIEKTSKDLQSRLNALQKKCPQVIKVKKPILKPTVIVKPETTQPSKPKVSLVPVPPTKPKEEPTKPETKTETVEQPKETDQEVVEYEWGGKNFEEEAIGIFNDIVNWFNSSSGVRDNKSNSTSSSDRLSSSDETCT